MAEDLSFTVRMTGKHNYLAQMDAGNNSDDDIAFLTVSFLACVEHMRDKEFVLMCIEKYHEHGHSMHGNIKVVEPDMPE